MSEDTFCGRGNYAYLFQKGQVFGMHQAEKTSKEMAETIKIGLTVQRIIKNWKDKGESSSFSEEMWLGKKAWMIVIGDHLNVWWNQIVKKQ